MSYCHRNQLSTTRAAPSDGDTDASPGGIAPHRDGAPSDTDAFSALTAILKTPSLAADFSGRLRLWTEIKRLADIHRLTGWLAHATSHWLPAYERSWRDGVLMAHHRRHRQFLNRLGTLMEAFAAERIPCVVLKGPVLAERCYATPFLKFSRDLDLLVRSSDIRAAADAMERLGFVMRGDLPWRLHRKYAHHLTFTGKSEVQTVDVHYALKAGPRLIASDEWMNRAIEWRSPDGWQCQVLSPPDEVLYLVIHAAGHAFHRLRWLSDALALAKTLEEADRTRVRSLAIEMGVTGYFVAADMACREFFGEPLPVDVTGFKKPWLWSSLQPRHVVVMARRGEYSFGVRALDVCRMSGTPLSALDLCLENACGRLATGFYRLRGGALGPEVLAKSLRREN
jgi:hypothetical protein